MNDGGSWAFEQSGKPYPFENLSAYEKPRKRDRFTRDMLVAYVQRLSGVDPFKDESFIVNRERPAILLERRPHQNETRDFSLEEVLAGKPWLRSK